jgi:hypothetical protein
VGICDNGVMVRRSTTEWSIGDGTFIEVMHALTNPQEPWTYPDAPNILSALEELIAWANDGRTYDPRFHEAAWRSAINDFRAATKYLGVRTRQVLKPHVDAILGAYHPGLGGDQALKLKMAGETKAMRRTLADRSTLSAAWDDLIRVCSRKKTPMNIVAARRDAFWAVVQATDRNMEELSRSLTSVLTGDARAMFRAKLRLGEADALEFDFQSLRSCPPASPPERLEIAKKILDVEPELKAHVVWLAFRQAYLNDMRQQFGYIHFFDARWLRGNLFEGGPSRDQLPSELDDLDRADSIPDQQDVVLARIDLGICAFADVVRIATQRADALVGISTLGCQIPWKQMRGFIHAEDGKIASHQFFKYETDIFSPYALHDTAVEIGRKAARVAPIVAQLDTNMRDIVDALHWWRAGMDQPSAASVVLNVRAIELVASRIGEPLWTTYLENYMKNSWIYGTIADTLYIALHEALHRRVSVDAQAKQRELFLDVNGHEDGRQTFSVRRALGRIDEIIEFIPSNLPIGRDLRTIKQKTANAAAIQNWCSGLEKLWKAGLERLERLRNSISHGGPFTEQVVQLVHPFSQRLSSWALTVSIEGYLEGKTLAQSQAELKDGWDQWRLSMQRVTSADDIFNHGI